MTLYLTFLRSRFIDHIMDFKCRQFHFLLISILLFYQGSQKFLECEKVAVDMLGVLLQVNVKPFPLHFCLAGKHAQPQLYHKDSLDLIQCLVKADGSGSFSDYGGKYSKGLYCCKSHLYERMTQLPEHTDTRDLGDSHSNPRGFGMSSSVMNTQQEAAPSP